MRQLLCLCFLFGSGFLIKSIAQPSFTASDKETARKISQTTLSVVMKEAEEGDTKKLKNPAELQEYLNSIKRLNELLRNSIEKEWNLSKTVEFVSEQEGGSIKKEKSAGHFLLEVRQVKNYKMGDFYGMPNTGSLQQSQSMLYHLSPSGKTYALSISPASRPGSELVVSYFPLAGLSPGSVTLMVRHLKNQITDGMKGITSLSDLKKDVDKRSVKLKSKTLLIFDPLISDGLSKVIKKGDLKEHYPYPYKVASFEEVDEAITKKDPNYAIIWVVPSGAVGQSGALYNYFILDVEDGRPLFMTGRGFDIDGGFHQGHLRAAARGTD